MMRLCNSKNPITAVTTCLLLLHMVLFPVGIRDFQRMLLLLESDRRVETLSFRRWMLSQLVALASLLGFLAVANEVMVRPIREISVMRGFDIKAHVLATFGGAGPQHACAIARALGISKIFIHRFSGIMSAYGMGMADLDGRIRVAIGPRRHGDQEDQSGDAQEFVHVGFSRLTFNISGEHIPNRRFWLV